MINGKREIQKSVGNEKSGQKKLKSQENNI